MTNAEIVSWANSLTAEDVESLTEEELNYILKARLAEMTHQERREWASKLTERQIEALTEDDLDLCLEAFCIDTPNLLVTASKLIEMHSFHEGMSKRNKPKKERVPYIISAQAAYNLFIRKKK